MRTLIWITSWRQWTLLPVLMLLQTGTLCGGWRLSEFRYDIPSVIQTGKRLTSTTYFSFTSRGIGWCATECRQRQRCLSFNYDRANYSCQLNEGSFSNGQVLLEDSNFLYSEPSLHFENLLGGCAGVACTAIQKCIINANMQPQCVPIVCSERPPPLDGATADVDGTSAEFGTSASYSCKALYKTTGSGAVICLSNGDWQTPLFHCEGFCENNTLPTVALASIPDALQDTFGSTNTYVCQAGYYLSGSIPNTTCQTDHQWSLPHFTCITCSPPPTIANAEVQNGSIFVGDTRIYSCNDGYAMNGTASIQCLYNAVWSTPGFTCITCSEPPVVANASVVAGPILVGSSRTYQCDYGHEMVGTGTIQCQNTATWSTLGFSCDPNPPSVTNAQVVNGDKFVGTTRTYQCNSGYAVSGTSSTQCQGDATWSTPSFTCITCSDPPIVAHAQVQSGDKLVGTTRIYDCDHGYGMVGTGNVQCQNSATWSTPSFTCDPICVSAPPSVTNAQVQSGQSFIGSSRTYQCNSGYKLTGTDSTQCESGGTWSTPTFTCDTCSNPPIVAHAQVQSGQNLVGTTRIYDCDHGYEMVGTGNVQCQNSATWSTPSFTCDPICVSAPPSVTNAQVQSGQSFIGSSRTYQCNSGYKLTGTDTTQCESGGTWSTPTFTCDTCSNPPSVTNAQVQSGQNLVGSTRTYQCNSGYKLTGSDSIQCESTATWSTPTFTCDTCSNPPSVTNAQVQSGQNLVGSTRTYQCNSGYKLTGSDSIQCESSATWSTPTFTCDTCGAPPSVTNAQVQSGQNLVGSTRTYQCNSGYKLTGSDRIQCESSAIWSTPTFTCDTCSNPPSVANAQVLPGQKLIGSTRTYECNLAYIMTGSPNIECQVSATWLTPSFTCNEVAFLTSVSGSDGALISPNYYSGLYSPNLDILYTITIPIADKTVRVSASYEIQSSSSCQSDYLTIGNDGQKYCGNLSAIKDVVVTGTTFNVRFVSNCCTEAKGFFLTYSVL